jgi:hypothetical protein
VDPESSAELRACRAGSSRKSKVGDLFEREALVHAPLPGGVGVVFSDRPLEQVSRVHAGRVVTSVECVLPGPERATEGLLEREAMRRHRSLAFVDAPEEKDAVALLEPLRQPGPAAVRTR